MALHQTRATQVEATRLIRVLRPKLNSPQVRAGTGEWIWFFLLALASIAAWERSRATFLWSVASCAAIAVLGVLLLMAYLLWVRIDLRNDGMRLRRLTGTRQLERSEVCSLAPRDVRSLNGGRRAVLILYSRDHRCLAKLDRRLWSDDTVQALASWMGAPLPASKTTNDRGLETEFAGSVSVVSRHGTLVAFAIVFVPIIVIVLVKAA